MDNGATLTAGSGRVNLMSVASTGEVDISGTDPVMNGVTAQGDVTIRASSKIDVNGDGGGRVFIRGGNVVLENASIEAKTTGATAGQGVDIAASNALTFTHSLIDTATGGTGNGGNVALSAADITLDASGASADEVFIDTRTDGLADAGNITLTATNSITLDATGASARIRIHADSLAVPGLAGDIALNANSIVVQGQALFSLSSTATDAASIGSIGATAPTTTVDGQEGSLLVDKTGVGGFYVITNVILDGSLGPARSVAGPAYTVQEAWGTVSGANLFHSAKKFIVDSGESVIFEHVVGIDRIIIRVTGGDVTTIDGAISASNGADVCIVNPAGVVFSSNASMSTVDTLHVSTADYLDFSAGDTDRFLANDSQSNVFSTAPVAFGFLGAPGGNISVDGASLTVAADMTLSLIGGDLLMDNGATLTAGSGRVNLMSVASTGEVDISGTDPVMNGVTAQGELTIRASSEMDVNGLGGGRAFIRGGNVVLQNASVEAETTGATAGLGVDIAASNALTFTHSLIDTSTGGAGNGGNVFLSAADMTLDASGASADAVFIDTRTDGAGNAGNITLTATNSITLDASGASVQIGIFADSLATPGEAGDIALNANAIIVQEEGLFLLSSTAADGASIGSIDATASTITVDGHEGILRVDVTGKGGFYVFTNVILDGSLGPARSVGGPAYTVLEAWGTISGANLFHSFEKLVIEPGESIAFEHSGPIERIIVRVTDGEVFSNDGEISSSSGADVYIINPAGVAFTSNTSLGTIGALHVSTADYVDFSAGDTDRFFADDAESTVFSAAPVAFGFLNASVANIPVDGASLTVPADKTVSLIGGDISVHNGATLTAASGRVNLVSVASAGEVDMSGADPDASSFSTLGSVDIQGSSINTSTLFVAADDVAIDGASILTVATAATLNTGGICAGPITGAGTLTKEGDGVLTLSHGNNTYAGATTVEAGTLNVTGTLTDSVVTVNSGATLQGTGNIGGGVTVAAGATLTPGEGAGILSTGDLALNGGATFTVELNGITVGNDYDQVDVTGAVNLGGATLDLAVGFTPSYGPIAFTIVNNDGSDPVVNAFSNLGEGSVFTSGENHFRITYRGGDGNDVVLTYFRLQVPYILLLDDPEPIRPPRR
ncbi:MAG: filamentous hemagglutinin N-terminal domain-containing protein [Thermodesulfobacteriota bacterium]|nr:filamentous hemagglutinin N-terminal domain-containing protein [Thermodesulfobacteriota bacterium]